MRQYDEHHETEAEASAALDAYAAEIDEVMDLVSHGELHTCVQCRRALVKDYGASCDSCASRDRSFCRVRGAS